VAKLREMNTRVLSVASLLEAGSYAQAATADGATNPLSIAILAFEDPNTLHHCP
jgi:hypothetical protein